MSAPAGLRVRLADDHLLAVAGQQSRGAQPARVVRTEATVTRPLHRGHVAGIYIAVTLSLHCRYTAATLPLHR